MNKWLLLLMLVTQFSFAENMSAFDIKKITKEAEQGNIQAQSDLGFIYYEANVVPRNAEKAIFWSENAANAGSGAAQINLGYFYSIGFGVPKDITKTIYWYEAAAKQQIPLASYNLGSMYALGTDVKRDLNKAAAYFKKSAEKNHIPSLVALAGMYLNGEGLKKDSDEAVRNYEKAAELGDIQSHLDLGKIYFYGIGVDKSINNAKYWYLKAKNFGNKEAEIFLKELLTLEKSSYSDSDNKSTGYVQKLKQKYSKRLEYKNYNAQAIIQSFVLDCRSNDRRYLPLENVLLAKIASLDSERAWLVIRVDSNGSDIRIYDDLVSSDGELMSSIVAFEINKWGEIRSMNGRMDAVLNSCFGSYGPIWEIPELE